MARSLPLPRSSSAEALGHARRMRRDDRGLSRSTSATEERAMPHLLDPKRIDTQATYLAALHELDTLMDEDPDAGANNRIDELFALVEAYELRQPRLVVREV
jgi:hypothetical protein